MSSINQCDGIATEARMTLMDRNKHTSALFELPLEVRELIY